MNIAVTTEHHKDANPDKLMADAIITAENKAKEKGLQVGACIKTETITPMIGHEDTRKTLFIFETKQDAA